MIPKAVTKEGTVEAANVLRQVPIFTSLSDKDLQSVLTMARRRKYRRGEIIFHRDDPGTTCHGILSGFVRIYSPSADGDQVTLALLGPGEFFGELSLVDGDPRSATAEAVEDSETVVLHREDLLRFLRSHPDAAIEMMAVLAQRLRRTDVLVEDAAFLDIPARLAKRLMELVESHGVPTPDGVKIDVRLTHSDLAAMVGATRVSITRALGQYVDAGYIRVDDRYLIVRKPKALANRAQ